MFRVLAMLVVLFAISACVTSKTNETPVRKVSGATTETSMDTLLFSWTNNPLAAQNPTAYIAGQLKFALECLPKISGSKKPVKGCEGNGMFAGPGLYTCDNPFTSHDYGSTVIMVRAVAGESSFLNYIPENGYGGGTSGVDRELYGNAKYSAILYDFRASDFNTKALAIRNASIVSSQQPLAITLGKKGYKKFHDHAAYACTAQSTIADVLVNWGDHMEFMAKTFFSAMDPLGEQYFDKKTQSLNLYGWLAAASSDAVAVSEDALQKKISTLNAKFPDIAESMSFDACLETKTVSPRACLASRIFDSARGELGTDRYPTYAWEFGTAVKAFVELGLLTSQDAAKVKDNDQLMAAMTSRLQADSVAATRVSEAYTCMLSARASLEKNHLGLWAPQP